MTKIIEIEVYNCTKCPAHYVDSTRLIYDSFICARKEGGKAIKNLRKIPSWCPLPDKKETK